MPKAPDPSSLKNEEDNLKEWMRFSRFKPIIESALESAQVINDVLFIV